MASPQSAVSPLPLKQMFALAVVLLNESLCSTMLLPYVGLLVAHLQNRPPEEAGYFSGLLIGVFMLGQVVSGRLWGYISDQYGRRIPLLVGLFTSGIMMLGFGLGTHVWVCIVFRFFHGLFNGNVLVAKTVLADILDKTNEAKGFVLVSLTFGFGTLIGPAVGGLLYDPANSAAMRWAGFSKEGLFAQFPGLLPAFVVFLYTNFAMLVCIMYVHETNRNARALPSWLTSLVPCATQKRHHVALPSDEFVDTMGCVLKDGFIGSMEEEKEERSLRQREAPKVSMTAELLRASRNSVKTEIPSPDALVVVEEGSSAVKDAEEEEEKNRERVNGSLRDAEILEQHEDKWRAASAAATAAVVVVVVRENGTNGDVEGGEAKKESFGYSESFLIPGTRNVLILYMLLCASDMAFCEVFPLWAVAGEQVGGLGYHSDLLGVVLLSNSVPCVLSNIFFHVACRVVPDKMRLWRISILVMGLSIGVIPFAFYVSHAARFIMVLALCFTRQWFSAWAFSLITVFTARVAPSGFVGTMYGICQSCGAAMRCVVPVIVTPLFAWSIRERHIPPFNHTFVFIITSMVFGITSIVSLSVHVVEDSAIAEDQKDEVNESSVSDGDDSTPHNGSHNHHASVGRPEFPQKVQQS